MEGTTSTSNEGSKKRDLTQYKKMQTRNVSDDKISEAFIKTYGDFDVNCMAFNVSTLTKEVNGTSAVSASSADSYEFSLEELEKNSVAWVQPRVITPEKAPIIRKKRKAAKKRRVAEQEAREAEITRSINLDKETKTDLGDNR